MAENDHHQQIPEHRNTWDWSLFLIGGFLIAFVLGIVFVRTSPATHPQWEMIPRLEAAVALILMGAFASIAGYLLMKRSTQVNLLLGIAIWPKGGGASLLYIGATLVSAGVLEGINIVPALTVILIEFGALLAWLPLFLLATLLHFLWAKMRRQRA